ncbi:FAD dependent oxidoreductase [Basidiobolus meristosporus CBS 931.73]|uniref:FAD dependent oxidoreductase n=1 Tax=Basidiobolus meristosporus CBS 931.73 TaxID=1314790 RepID=A0A1Y1YU82_9FUNG|nr:FAD dependent oxidoreductase [Basidiobolus meristosporus CBS 931.73]|eukprot:ORY01526.1 FAD dependent oxidoreductase [Basidiobolus meristosporus CBS 931.73]
MNIAEKSVLILGGGCFGLSAAIELKNRGWSVTVLDRQPIPASDAASTDINKAFRPDYGGDEIYQALCIKAYERWKQWNQETLEAYQEKVFHECGVLFLCYDKMGEFDKKSIATLPEGFTHVYRTPEEIAAAYPTLSESGFTEGYLSKYAGWLNSKLGIQYACDKAKKMGVRFVEGETAGMFKEFLQDKLGNIKGIITLDGTEHWADLTIVASGAWTPSIVDMNGMMQATGHAVLQINIPESLRPRYRHEVLPVMFADTTRSGFYSFPINKDGNLKIACHDQGYLNFPKNDNRDTPISYPRTLATSPKDTVPIDAVRNFRSFIRSTYPELRHLNIAATRMCWYTDSWDGDFYIDHVPGRPGLFVATGGSGHGYKFLPVLGEVIADAVELKRSEITEKFKWRVPTATQKRDGLRCDGGNAMLDDHPMATQKELEGDQRSKL